MENRHSGSRLAAMTALLGFLGLTVAAQPQEEKALLRDTFETDAAGWMGAGPKGKLSITNEAANVKVGKGALEFSYYVGKAKEGEKKPDGTPAFPIDALLRPTPNGELAKMKSLRFWASTDRDAPFILSLTEKEGGRYNALFWLPKGSWQQVQIASSDFWLADDKNDPKDPNGKLDLDKVENIMLGNILGFFIQGIEDPESNPLVAGKSGACMLRLDDFTVSEETLPAAPSADDPKEGKGVWIDAFHRDTLAWFPIGNIQLRIDKDSPVKGRALRADYMHGGSNFVLLAHDIRSAPLAGTDHLVFEAASAKSTKILIQFEEKGGAKYNTTADIPGDSKLTAFSIPVSAFHIADDSPKDANDRLDMDQLKTFLVADIVGITGLSAQKNTLWLGPLRAFQSK